MKQTVIMIICVLVILIGGVSEIKYLEKSSTYIKYDMEYIENAVKNHNYELAREQMDNTLNLWIEVRNMWGMFVMHDEIDDIDDAIVSLKEYISYENEEECLVTIAKIKNSLEHSVRMQIINLDNII